MKSKTSDKKILYSKIKKYFVYTSFLDYLLNQIKPDGNEVYDLSIWSCFNAFNKSLMSYLLSVYDDLRYEEYDFLPKANANKLLLRNCIEAMLILNVLENHPDYASKYYATLESDKNRIKELYKPSEIEEEEKKKFMKRFSWLPRYLGKKANSISDLINYVDFDDETQKEQYKIIVKNFDSFIHPSFTYVETLNEEKRSNNFDGVLALFIDNGIIQEATYNILKSFNDAYKNRLNKNIFIILKEILDNETYNDFLIPIDLKELNKINYTSENKLVILSGIYSKFNIAKKYQMLNAKSPDYIGGIPYIIGMLANYIEKDNSSIKAKNTILLLRDLASRYDDMLHAVFEDNPMQFFAQSRFVIESLSIINILLNEDETRNSIYALHQSIKSYDAEVIKADFINANRADLALNSKNLTDSYNKNIEIIKNYYKETFTLDVEDRNIARLNGWAIKLKNINNLNVPNTPFFVNLLCETYFGSANKNISSLLLALFEESNAFTHVTPYAFAYGNDNFDLFSLLIFINKLASGVASNILVSFNLSKSLSKEQLQEIDVGFFKAIEAIKTLRK